VILGALLFVSPWLLSRSFASARADAFAGGALLVLVSLLAIAAYREWEEWINLAIGLLDSGLTLPAALPCTKAACWSAWAAAAQKR